MNIWQINAGKGSRDYSSVFLKFGVMLVGADDPGKPAIEFLGAERGWLVVNSIGHFYSRDIPG